MPPKSPPKKLTAAQFETLAAYAREKGDDALGRVARDEKAKLGAMPLDELTASSLDALASYARTARAQELEALTTSALNLWVLADKVEDSGDPGAAAALRDESQRASRSAGVVLGSVTG